MKNSHSEGLGNKNISGKVPSALAGSSQAHINQPMLTETTNCIGAQYTINDNFWTVSICRDRYSKNQQHAFLIVEGIDNGRHVLKKADLVNNSEKKAKFNAFSGYAKIRLFDYSFRRLQQEADGYAHITYEITKTEAQTLLSAIANDVGKDIVYNQAGNSWAYSAIQGSQPADNCASWAESKLKEINLTVSSSWINMIAVVPSWHIKDQEEKGNEETSGKCVIA